MTEQLSKEDIQTKYNDVGRTYDRCEWVMEILGMGRMRRRILELARGNVLEVAVGSGRNFKHYPKTAEHVIVGDLSARMIEIAMEKSEQEKRSVQFVLFDAESLPFPDDSFDTVISTLSTCTFPEPEIALQEMARVCRSDGRILLLEHGRSTNRVISWYQDQIAHIQYQQFGCTWNRDQLNVVRRSGLKVIHASRHVFGVFFLIDAIPGSASGD